MEVFEYVGVFPSVPVVVLEKLEGLLDLELPSVEELGDGLVVLSDVISKLQILGVVDEIFDGLDGCVSIGRFQAGDGYCLPDVRGDHAHAPVVFEVLRHCWALGHGPNGIIEICNRRELIRDAVRFSEQLTRK